MVPVLQGAGCQGPNENHGVGKVGDVYETAELMQLTAAESEALPAQLCYGDLDDHMFQATEACNMQNHNLERSRRQHPEQFGV